MPMKHKRRRVIWVKEYTQEKLLLNYRHIRGRGSGCDQRTKCGNTQLLTSSNE